MKVTILAVGRIREKYFKDGIAEYAKRLRRFCDFSIIEVDDETRASITKKVTAQQELELANIEAQTAKVQAEKDKEVAQIQAEQVKIKAQGEADAKKIAAEAEAEANKKISQSLTPELIEKIKYDKWDGAVSKYTGNTTPIVKIDE